MNEEQANKTLMARVTRAFAEGDMQPLLTALDDNVQWTSNSPVPYFRFGGGHTNRDGVKELLALIAATYMFRRFQAKEIVAEGETVWGLFEVEAAHQSSGKQVKLDLAIRWIMRDGKVISHQGFFDTASVLLQQGQDLMHP